MAIDYTEDRAGAHEAIVESGQLGNILRAPASTTVAPSEDWWNPSVGSAAGTPQAYPAWFTIVDYRMQDVDGTLVRRTDKHVLLSAEGLEIEPTDSDRLQEADGSIWEIVSVNRVKPASVVVMYDLQVRL